MTFDGEKLSESKSRSVVIRMFNSISKHYDFLNHFLSFGFDFRWRASAVRMFNGLSADGTVLDICAGTGDMTFALFRKTGFDGKAVLLDGAESMLKRAKKKSRKKSAGKPVEFIRADAQKLPVPDNCFEGAMVAFGIRNLSNPTQALSEVYRILKKGGEYIVLEFSMPTNWFMSGIYKIYFLRILPVLGRLISSDKSAYSYLPSSVLQFNEEYDLVKELRKAGFSQIKTKKLTAKIVTIYYSKK